DHPDQTLQAGRVSLDPLHLVPVLGLPGEPGPVDARPFAEIQNPAVVLRLLAAVVGGIEDLRAQAVFALELQQLLLQGMDAHEDLPKSHRPPPAWIIENPRSVARETERGGRIG